MKINFGDYTWFGDLNDKRNIIYNPKDQTQKEFASRQFDKLHFNKLIVNREYEKAANYANKYHFNDPKKQRQHLNAIANIRRQGRILSSCYSKLTDDNQKNAVEFIDNVFIDGGINKLKHNIWTDTYQNAIDALGSKFDGNKKQIAKSLDVVFYPKTRKLFGIDWLAKDNDNNIDAFYEKSGLNEQALKSAGVKVELKDGKTTLHFDKSNKLASKIIANLYNRNLTGAFGSGDDRSSWLGDLRNIVPNDIIGYDIKGNKIEGVETSSSSTWLNTSLANHPLARLIPEIINVPLDVLSDLKGATMQFLGQPRESEDGFFERSKRGYHKGYMRTAPNEYLTRAQAVIQEAQEIKDNYFQANKTNLKQYSSTAAGNIDDNLAMLQDALNNGEIDKQTFNREYRINCGYIDDMLRNIGSGQYEMYSNKFNENPKDETLREITDNRRSELVNAITSTDKSKMHLVSMISNGKIGTLVELDAPGLTSKQQEKLEGEADDQLSNGKRIQIFIPGLFQEQAQEKINRNTSTQAIQEANSMQDFDYDYKTQDGKTLTYDGLGGYIYDGEQIDKDNAIKIINKDLIIQDAVNNLQFKYLNKDNVLIDKKNYENEARDLAIRACNDIYPGIALSYTDGTPLTKDEVFSHSKANPDDVYFGKMQYQVYDKLQNLYDVYNALMDAISYYN